MSVLKRFSLFLLPSIFQGVISILTLPIITLVLGPEQYGIFALVTSFTAFGTVIASAGSGYLFAAYYPIADDQEKKKMVSTILSIGMFAVVIFGMLLLVLWPWFAHLWPLFRAVPRLTVILSLASVVLGLPWIFVLDIITLDGKAKAFATILITQSIIGAAATIVSLFLFSAGIYALFIGVLAGNIVLFIGAFICAKPYLSMIFSFSWAKKIIHLSLVAIPTSFAENLHTLMERFVLSLHVGFAQLGIYSHSQQYKTMSMMALKAASRTLWPITLSEARDPSSDFPKTKDAWDAINVGITLLGILFATLGRDIISLLTHGKFTDASIFVVFWMIFLLIQNAGRPHSGVLYAKDQGAAYAGMQLGSILLSIFVLFALVPVIGVFGAVAALFARMIIFRIWIQLRVRHLRNVPFQDWSVLWGCLFIIATLALSTGFELSRISNIALLLIMSGILMIASKAILKKVLSRFIA